MDNLRAPHNIQEFLFSTRSLSSIADALSQIERFKDIVQEYVQAIGQLEEWMIIGLIVVAAGSNNRVPCEIQSLLYEYLYPDQPPYKSFNVAVRAFARLCRNLLKFTTGASSSKY